ncbi:hypothetical protein BG000_006632 [Podila horticola]|nr:hypothetical protein BG000_006632 [Podila horticola]
MKLWLVASLLGLVTAALARPELVISDDQRGLIYMGSFGFLAGGTFDMDLKDLKISINEGDTGEEDRIGFLIQRGSIQAANSFEWEYGCILDDHFFKEEIARDPSMFQKLDPAKKTFQYHHVVTRDEEEMWNLIFINCPRSLVSFKLKTTEINPGMNYLSAGDILLPKVYGASAIAYFAAGAVWASMLMRKDTKVFWPHKLILILAIMIGIHKTFQTIKIHYMQTGSNSEGWTVMFCIFAFLKGSLSILIITLIASGWMFMKPFLNDKDKKIILVIIPLQILANVAKTISEETAIGSLNWAFWTQIFPMVDFISFVVILGVIIQTQRHLSEAAEAEGKVAENKSKYKLWGSFYIVTVVYIYLTKIIVQFLKVSLPYQYVNWLVELLNEVITLGFCITIGWKFRPYANNPYTLVDEDDLDREDIENGSSGSDAVGLQSMSRREGRGATAE